MGDSCFRFSAPWSNPIFSFDGSGSSVNVLRPGTANILAADLQRIKGSSTWDKNLFYENTWYFVGPWFSGVKERLKAGGVLVTTRGNSWFNEANLFHPRVFESAIANYLDENYGYRRSGKKADFRGPLNWRVLFISSCIQAVVCDIHYIANGGKEYPDLRRLIFFPISQKQFIRINFTFGGLAIYNDEVRSKPLLTLCDAIINSMRLEVGKATHAEWDKVKATCSDMSLTETFGELPWPLCKEKPNNKMLEVNITPRENPKAVSHKS